MGVKRSCGKRLFFSKKLRPKAPVEDSCPTSIHNVTSLLGKFVLDKDEEEVRDNEVVVGPPGYEQGLITEKGQDNTVQDNHDEGEFFDGSCQQAPFTSSTQIILEGSNEHGGLRQDSVGMTVPSQVFAYLLLSSASSGIPRTNKMRWRGDNIVTDSSAAAISMSLLAFIALACSSIIAGYKIFTKSFI
ncbi:unnamed protein product [Amaranthus hypochondriacus]